MKRYISSFKTIEDFKRNGLSLAEINEKLTSFHVKLSTIKLETLIELSSKRVIQEDEPVEFFYYNNKKFVHFKKPHFSKEHRPPPSFLFKNDFGTPPSFSNNFDFKPDDIILIDELDEQKFKDFWLIVLVLIDILLIWFLIFLRSKLKPLLSLKENMIRLSKGELTISTKINGKDEISQVANEFDNAIKQLRQLRESRNLFLRNIMHELKTPITKGKLISDTLEENERKYILIRVFQRLEYLLSEFSKIEELTSGKIKIIKSQYRVIDLIEQALDILLLDDSKIDIEHNDNPLLNVDYELFSIALKNLIDNAIKYNKNGNPVIIIEKEYIKIVNKGDKLKKNIDEYYKPFNHEYETASDGLGLGLYISNNIINIHNYKLEYEYIDSHHNFMLKIN